MRADYRFIESQVYSLPFSLRFPRIKRVRYDKSFAECVSDREVRDMFESAKHDPCVNIEFTTANMLRCNKPISKKRTGSAYQVLGVFSLASRSRPQYCVVTAPQVAGSFRRIDCADGDAALQVSPVLFDGMEACVLGDDDARIQITKMLKAGGAKLMTSKNTLDDEVRLFSSDSTNARYRRYAALDAPDRPDIMHSRSLPCTAF